MLVDKEKKTQPVLDRILMLGILPYAPEDSSLTTSIQLGAELKRVIGQTELRDVCWLHRLPLLRWFLWLSWNLLPVLRIRMAIQ